MRIEGQPSNLQAVYAALDAVVAGLAEHLAGELSRRVEQALAPVAARVELLPVPLAERLLLRSEEAAELLSVSRSTVYRLIKDGLLPVVMVGGCKRIPRRALDDLVERLGQQTAEQGERVRRALSPARTLSEAQKHRANRPTERTEA